ncbi:MAG: LPS export ABC transporter periplasmic protein LptC [Pseudomonadota bacterium]
MLNRWGGWLVLISLALATTWLVRSSDDDLSKQTESSLQVFDYTLKNFKSTQMDEQGQLKNQLTAETMIHYPDSNATLIAPYMVFYKEALPTWTVRAEQGEISPDGNQVWLLGNTILGRQQMEIISRDVRVQLDTEHAETTAPTTIISNNAETHSVGMRVFLSTERVDLLSQVRGHYVLP